MTISELPKQRTEHFDVLIVGAGISGIGAACHLERSQPGKSYAVLEARDAIGGTWDLFRYPGIRSDSDLHTFGYAFKPWTDNKAIADGDSIRAYIEETAHEYGVDRQIRFGHRMQSASWSSEEARWTIDVERVATGETIRMTAGWIFSASGYYRYDEGFSPHFEGSENFRGQIIHPQHWPTDLDYSGKRVIVIGSGATAMTLVPAMAEKAGHVTMLQRSPSYVVPLPAEDPVNSALRRRLGEERAYRLTRTKNILRQRVFYSLCRRFPRLMRHVIRRINAAHLPEHVPVDVHFKPSYDPWDQRLCVVPDADLYRAFHRKTASIATGHIETFTESGIRLKSGEELEADIIVTATGLNLQAYGGIEMTVDGREISLPETIAYKGMMLSGVPNLVYAIGYTNASWTLKIDLVCEHFCRLLAHLDKAGLDAAVPVPRDPDMQTQPLLDFEAGYVLRSIDQLPKQGEREPWYLAQDYFKDARYLRRGDVEDGEMQFFAAGDASAALDDPALAA